MLSKHVRTLPQSKPTGNKHCLYDIVEEEMLIIKVFVVILRHLLRFKKNS